LEQNKRVLVVKSMDKKLKEKQFLEENLKTFENVKKSFINMQNFKDSSIKIEERVWENLDILIEDFTNKLKKLEGKK
jgi:L-lactate utilization protein LutB